MTTMVMILVTNLMFMTTLTSEIFLHLFEMHRVLAVEILWRSLEILAKYIVMDDASCSKNDDDYKDDEYVEKMMTMTTKSMAIMWTMMMLMMI